MITQKRLKELFSYDEATGDLRWNVKSARRVKIGDIAGTKTPNGHIQIRVDDEVYLAHRLVWTYMKGYHSEYDIIHIDGVKSNNKIDNLQEKTHQCVIRNIGNYSNNVSGVKGVSKIRRSGKWYACIRVNRKNINVGLYTKFADAVKARYEAEERYGW